MLTIPGHRQRFCDGLSRRSFLRIGALGLGAAGIGGAGPRGLSLADVLRAGGPGAERSTKSVIMVYLPGGPTQHETFDPKPEAPREIRGPFRPIPTNLEGVQFCELLPLLARRTDRLAIIRSMVGTVNRHESFHCYTGRPGGRPGDEEPAGGWPTFGATVSRLVGSGKGGVPAYVDAGPKMGYGPYNNTGLHDASAVRSWPGFTGIQHTPFQLHGDGEADLVLNGVTPNRLEDRKTLLLSFDRLRRQLDADGSLQGLDGFRRQAFDILTSQRLAEALDLEREDPRVRERYGTGGPTTSSFGGAPKNPQNLLLARRLVEAGVRCVTVAFGAWDWHGNRGGPVEKLGREDLPVFDHALSTLIEDLDQRGLLDDVSVVVWGEFGRTPRLNAKGGRDHWDRVESVLLAGGGLRVGQVIGSTDRDGGVPNSRPVHIQEVFATLYDRLGIDVSTATVADFSGRPHYLVDEGRKPIPELVG